MVKSKGFDSVQQVCLSGSRLKTSGEKVDVTNETVLV